MPTEAEDLLDAAAAAVTNGQVDDAIAMTERAIQLLRAEQDADA